MKFFHVGVLLAVVAFYSAGPAFAQFGEIRGTVVEQENKQPLAGVNVIIQGTTQGAATDNDGNFHIRKVPVGAYSLNFSYIGFEKKCVPDVMVKTNKITYANAALSWEIIKGQEIAVTAGYFQQPEEVPVSVQTLSYEEIRRSPGSREDVSRMVQNLPGVNPTSDDRNDLVVRGGSPAEVLFMIDNIEIPNPNHFGTQGATGGPISMVNAEFVENVTFMAGGYSAAYGHKLSGVMDIEFREGNRQEYNGKLDLNFGGAGGYFEGPLGDSRGSFLIGVHRSFLDLFKGMLNWGGVPIYSNLQGKVVFDLDKNHRLSMLMIGGDDRLNSRYILDIKDFESGIPDTVEYGNFTFRSRQMTAGTTLRSFWSRNFYTLLSLSHSYNRFFTDANRMDVSGLHKSGASELFNKKEFAEIDVYDNTSVEQSSDIKLDASWAINRHDVLSAGIYGKFLQFDHDIISLPFDPARPDYTGQPQRSFTVNNHQNVTPKTGLYLNYKNRFRNRFVCNIGGRYDYLKLLDAGNFSPRFSLLVNATERLTFNAAGGRYYQHPEFIYITSDPSNVKNLKNIGCDHFIAGLNYLLTADTRLTFELYRKHYFNYPVSADENYEMISMANSGADYGNSGDAVRLLSEGKGGANGVEFMIQKRLAEKIYGLVSYSLSEIKHQARDGVMRNGRFDNRHVFNFVGGYRFNKSLEFSFKWRYAGGQPYTPFDTQASIAAGSGQADMDHINEERYPPYHRLDIRMDNRDYFKFGTLISYISIENVYNRKNTLYHDWNPEQNRLRYYYQSGMFIVGGISLEF